MAVDKACLAISYSDLALALTQHHSQSLPCACFEKPTEPGNYSLVPSYFQFPECILPWEFRRDLISDAISMFSNLQLDWWLYFCDFYKDWTLWCYFLQKSLTTWQYWRSVMGNSDDDGGEDFEGFTLHEIVKGDESDIDLNTVVQSQQLIQQFSPEISSNSDLNWSGSGGEELLGEWCRFACCCRTEQGEETEKTVKKEKRHVDHVMVSSNVESAPRKSVPWFCWRWNCQSGRWPHSTSRCHSIRILLFSVAGDILDWCGTSDKCVCWTKAAEQRAWQDLKGDYSCWNEIIHFHSVHVWDPLNARKGHVLVHWSPSSGFCHCWCDEQRLISKAEPVLPSERQLGCRRQRVTWIRPFVESLPSAWCHHCQQPCPLFLGRDISIDEAVIKLNGCLSFKQYIKNVYC